MKKNLLFVTVGFLILSNNTAFAKSDALLIQEATKNVVTVAKAKTLKDETGVTLTGIIVKHISGDDFEFSDSTGSILIDVDDDQWKQMQLKSGDKVKIIGEIDTHRIKPTDIEVVKIERIK